ncbi:MAG TPA: hypothetical protein VI911_02535 [Patescibacteria group bacterium]|nr:hypothetical protein [Patescibacteria group bacterium]
MKYYLLCQKVGNNQLLNLSKSTSKERIEGVKKRYENIMGLKNLMIIMRQIKI